jgi:hypothetical protein
LKNNIIIRQYLYVTFAVRQAQVKAMIVIELTGEKYIFIYPSVLCSLKRFNQYHIYIGPVSQT